nr:hypothetical protein [Pirellula sp.]
AFHAFLSEYQRKGWIHSWTWNPFKREALMPEFSKTNKESQDGVMYQLEIESSLGYRTGVDLEYYLPDRPIFQNKDWLERRLKIPSATIGALSAEQLLEQWSFREAAFKALYPHNLGVVLSDFEIVGEDKLRLALNEEEYLFALAGEWQGPWFLALARRNF